MKNLLTKALLFLLPAISVVAQTATITPSATTYSSTGGTVTFTVNFSYPGTLSALGLSIGAVPPGWAYSVTAGPNIPDVRPGPGDTDSFDFGFITIPASSASFSFSVTYPSGLTGNQTFSGITGIFRPSGNIAIAPVVISPPGVPPSPQTITFGILPTKTFGDAAFLLGAAASSGLPVSYTSSNTSVATINGNTVTIVGAGTTNITASQAGNATIAAAPDVVQPLTINRVNQTITFGPLATKTLVDLPFALTATASSGLPVSYVSSDTSVVTVIGNTVTIVGVGFADITASQAGNSNFNPAAPTVMQRQAVVAVPLKPQTVTFGPLPAKTLGDLPFALTATASSGLPVNYVSSDTNVVTINGSTATLVGAGSANITASQAGNATFSAAQNVVQAQGVNKASQTITFGVLPTKTFGDAAFMLGATASSGLPVGYTSSNTSVATINGKTVTVVGVGSTTITASQAGNASSLSARDVVQPLTINRANQTITFGLLATKTLGGAPFALTAAASSGLPVSYVSSDPSVVTISGNTVTIVGVGFADITASQAGNFNYNPAAPTVVQRQTVVAEPLTPQMITFGSLPAKTFGDPPFALTATASSGLSVSYVSSDTNVVTINGSTVTIVGAGSANITASQTGNATFAAAPNVMQAQGVNKAIATVTLGGLAGAYDGTPKSATTTTNPSGLLVDIAYNGSATPPTYPGSYPVVATINDRDYSGSVSGTETITITALVRHAPIVNGSLDGSVQMLLGENVSLNGSSMISGDLLAPGTPTVQLSSTATYAGTLDGAGAIIPAGYGVTLNDTSLMRHAVRRIDPIALPVVGPPPAPLGTRIVSLTSTTQSPGDFMTLRNLSLNLSAGLVVVPAGTYGSFSANGNSGFVLGVPGAIAPSVYNFQSLALNVLPGIAQLQIVGPVIVNLANGSLMNGASGVLAHPQWLTIRVTGGGLTMSGNFTINGSIVAPNSTVTLNGNAIVNGNVIADRLIINGTSVLNDPNL